MKISVSEALALGAEAHEVRRGPYGSAEGREHLHNASSVANGLVCLSVDEVEQHRAYYGHETAQQDLPVSETERQRAQTER